MRMTKMGALFVVLSAVIGLGCSKEPAKTAGYICNLPTVVRWTRSECDTYLGAPLSADNAPDGRADVVYAYQGTSYYLTFANTSPQATMTSILIETAESFIDPDRLMFAMGYAPAPSQVSAAPARIVYSTAGTSLVELAVMRSPLAGGDWRKVFVQLVPFD